MHIVLSGLSKYCVISNCIINKLYSWEGNYGDVVFLKCLWLQNLSTENEIWSNIKNDKNTLNSIIT